MSKSNNRDIFHKNPANCGAPFVCHHACYTHCVWNREFLTRITNGEC